MPMNRCTGAVERHHRNQELRAAGANLLWSWDITYLPTTARGIWLYLYLVIDVWSRKVVAWDVEELENPAIAVELVSRACLRERISKGRKQPWFSMPTTATPCVRPRWKAGLPKSVIKAWRLLSLRLPAPAFP